jgi:uncharacterized protein (DUF1501 family)
MIEDIAMRRSKIELTEESATQPASALLRRDFVKLAGLSGMALCLSPQIASAETPAATRNTDTIVVIYLRGAMDGLNAIVPFTEASYFSNRTNIAIAKPDAALNPAINLDNSYALHPALAPLKPIWDAGELAIAHAVGLSTPSRSHFDAQDFMERAWLEKSGPTSGWLNRFLGSNAATSDATFRAVGLGRALPRSLSGSAPVVGLSSIASFGISSRSTRKTDLSASLQASFSGASLLDSSGNRAFAAVRELQANPAANLSIENAAVYPNTTFGNQLKDLAQLIKSGIGVEVATLDLGGWDTHNNQATELNALLDQLAKSLAAFRTDLGARMKNVTVVSMTEFGRRVAQNGSQGTDHGRASCMFMLGGGVAGRQVYADWPGLAANQLEGGDLRVTTDYRNVLSELLSKRAGVAANQLGAIFPEFSSLKTPGLFLTRA